MSGFVMRTEKKSTSTPARSADYSARRKDRTGIPAQLRARLGALAYTHEIHPGGEARSTGVGRGQRSNKSSTGKRVAIIQRMLNSVVQRCADEGSVRKLGRMNMAGKKHPVSGVEFDLQGYPVFDVIYEVQLNSEKCPMSRETHSTIASKRLYADIMKNGNLKKLFTDDEIEIFKIGGVPAAYTWHHHQDIGKMQLVKRSEHRKTGHIGGFSLWGLGN